MRFASEFSYVGSIAFVLKHVARVERHHFVDDRRAPRRLIVVQFEAFLPGVNDTYRYALHDPVRLGAAQYGRSAGTLRVSDERASAPEAEMARTAEFLARKGITLADAHAVARYARIVGGDRRKEILIFYHEIGGSPADIHERAMRAFELTATAQPDGRADNGDVSREAFAIVLHSHLPYARGAGRWPHGEEWVHEAILGTYLPLLSLLHDLRDDGVGYRITIGLTPPLLEQLADADIDHRFIEYCDDQIKRADQDTKRFGGNGDTEHGALAMFYASLFRSHREAYVGRFGRDLVGAFADLARTGHVEILTSAATHGYLPLLDADSVHAQLAVGTRTTRRRTGIDPHGIWLPECAYAPGLENIIESYGITHFFTDPALLGGERLVAHGHRFDARRSGDAIAAPLVDTRSVDVLRPYLVRESKVAAIARHDKVAGQVWSAMMGYPGDAAYREFHRKDEKSGLRYWRVTDVRVDLGGKHAYSPGEASERVRAHADHFVQLVRETLSDRTDRRAPALLTVTFDAELFGHWWFEGIDWLGRVLRELAARGPRPVTVAEYLRTDPPRERVDLQEGSWGKNNDHSTWMNERTEWMWVELGRMAIEMTSLRSLSVTPGVRDRAARQAARELLLAQSSDWPFLVTTGQAADYAVERFRSHAMRFRRAAELALRGTADDEVELRSLERADNPFRDASPADFSSAAGALVAR